MEKRCLIDSHRDRRKYMLIDTHSCIALDGDIRHDGAKENSMVQQRAIWCNREHYGAVGRSIRPYVSEDMSYR